MRTHWKVLAYVAQSMRDRGHPPTLQDIGPALKNTSKTVLAQTLERLEADGWIERDPQAPYGFRLAAHGQQAEERTASNRRTHPQPPREAVNATIKALDNLIEACAPQAMDATLEDLVTYIHARQNVIRAERALLGEVDPDDK